MNTEQRLQEAINLLERARDILTRTPDGRGWVAAYDEWNPVKSSTSALAALVKSKSLDDLPAVDVSGDKFEGLIAQDAMLYVYMDPDRESEFQWVLTGDLRPSETDDDDGNYPMADFVRDRNLPGVVTDCEFSCFWAYTRTKEDALRVVDALKEWMTDHGRR